VDTQNPADTLYKLVKTGLDSSAVFHEVEAQVQAVAVKVGIPDAVASDVIERFRSELQSCDVPAAPRLLVDWGELPRVGHQVRPEFSLLCPQYSSRPELTISVDQELDHNVDDVLRRPQFDETGLWSFHVPFRMTSDTIDCRPGQYMIDVGVTFHDVPAELPRFYRCRIRLNVSNADSEQGGVLEIDGDGQSMVNLQGYNLKQFSRVVLKGGEDSVINLQDAIDTTEQVSGDIPDKPATTFEYQLKVDAEKQARLPTVALNQTARAYLDACGFFFADGRRSLVMTRPRLTFGRSRDNDVILRFLPPGPEHNELSKIISRTHFIEEPTSEGVDLRDESRAGMEVNYSVVRDRELVPALHAGDHTHIDLGVTGTVPQKFELEMVIFAPDRREHRDELEYWDELYCEIVGGRLSRIAREALDARINAVRFDRVGNLAGEESYVHLLREIVIGGSPSQSSIVLQQSGPQAQARLLHIDRSFWLEPLPGADSITIDGVPAQARSLTPLAPGMQIQFGSEQATFDRPSQLYLN